MSWTLTTSQALVIAAGFGVSSDASSSAAILRQVADRAEGTFNAFTRYDWVSNATLIPANFLGIVNDSVTKLGASDLITYDMRGYGSSVIAQTMLDKYADDVRRNIALLDKMENKEVFI